MDAKGQGLLEVMLVLPLLFMMVILMFRFNMALQMGINNVQFARSQIYILSGNSPEYPRLQFRHSPGGFFSKSTDMILLGVADPQAIDEETADNLPPIPQVQRIGRKGLPGVSTEPGEGLLRSEVNVRETSAICTQTNGISAAKPFTPSQIPSLKPTSRWPFSKLPCQYEGQWIGGLNE
ncbi:MAG: hypothetical protein EBX52_09730 [Proteobacteria bacterium]|nr:hypothetical protein [Pseudomonadota bacterium]